MVRVHWIDASMSADAHWSDGDKPPRPKSRDHMCVTVGLLTHIDGDFLQLVQTMTDGAHANVVTIPAGMVRGAIEVLAVAEKVEPNG
jgi:hypothetical protein